jgi:hypothetical protein
MVFEMTKIYLQEKFSSTYKGNLVYIMLVAFWFILTLTFWFFIAKILGWIGLSRNMWLMLQLINLVAGPVIAKKTVFKLFEPLTKRNK